MIRNDTKDLGINKTDDKENSIYWFTNDKMVQLTLNQPRFINKVLELEKKHPNKITLIAGWESGTLIAEMPIDYLKILDKRNLSEEQKEKLRERLNKMRDNK